MFFDTHFIEMFVVIDANYAVALNSIKKLRARADINKAEIKAIDNSTGVVEVRAVFNHAVSEAYIEGIVDEAEKE